MALKAVFGTAALVAMVAGCSTLPEQRCGSPSPSSGALAMAAAAAGHALDEKTGGGRGFEKVFGGVVEGAARNCPAPAER